MIGVFAALALAGMSSAVSPTAQFAGVERALPFHVLRLPLSMQLLRAQAGRAADGAPEAVLNYRVDGVPVSIEERAAPSSIPTPPSLISPLFFDLEGYQATYSEVGLRRHPFARLEWDRPDAVVVLTTDDLGGEALLVSLAMSLR